MELHLTPAGGFFPNRAPQPAGRLSLHTGEAGTLLVENAAGVSRYPFPRGEATLPPEALQPGENRLRFRTQAGLLPCEGLVLEANTLRPGGFDPLPLLCHALLRLEKAEQALTALQERLAKAEARLFAPALF